MSDTHPIRIAFAHQPDAHALGLIHFATASTTADAATPQLQLGLSTDTRSECWSSDLPVQYGQAHGLAYAHNGTALFAAASRAVRDEATFDQDVEAMYKDVLALTRTAGYPHLLRMWNYFPDIHSEFAALDRYQRFCLGRQRAFAAHGVTGEREFPAATVIGTATGPIAVYFLAARTAGEPLENPRQVSAYRYPAQYGPASPAFSRGVLKRWNGSTHFYISGTASIVGHETQHTQQLDGQLDEILRNLQTLVTQAATATDKTFNLESAALLKVYVRKRDDLPAVRAHLQRALPRAEPLFCIGDICRRDLLVEIEAVAWAIP